MRKSLFLLFIVFWTGLSVGGCATKTDVFDADAVPMARADLRFDIEFCNARTQNLSSKTEAVECWLRAQQRFVSEIKLRRPELFDNYAARVRMLAVQVDGKTITADEFAQRYQQLTDEFDAAVYQIHDAEQSR
jgi:hypothetical protein